MYNDIDKKFNSITQKALPYLVLAPSTFRNELVELMDALFHQLLQRSEADFDVIYGQINEKLDERKKFESLTEIKLHNFAGRFETQEWQISKMNKRLDKSERKIESLEKSVKTLSAMIKKTTPVEKVHATPVEKVHAIPEEKVQEIAEEKVQGIAEEKVQGIAEEKVQGIAEEKVQGIAEEKVQGIAEEKVQGIAEEVPMEVPLKRGDYVKPSLIKIKEHLKQNKEIENKIIRKICGVTANQAKYLLQRLVKDGVIRRSGPLKRPEYIIL